MKPSLLLLFICSLSSYAHSGEPKISYEECNYMSSSLNTHLPKRIDKFTTTDSTVCTHGKSNRVVLQYRNTIDLHDIELAKKAISKTHKLQKNNVCSNPKLNALVDKIDMSYVFNDNNGQYLDEFTIKIEDCTQK